MKAEPFPKTMDISVMELMELVLAAIVLSLVQSLCFYEKVRSQLLGRGSCMFLLRTEEQLKWVVMTIT